MISGYFLADKITFRWKSLLNIWIQTVFYGVIFSISFHSISDVSFGKNLFHALTPVYQQEYWFVTKYIGLMLIAPFLSFLIRGLSKEHYQWLLGIGFVMCFQFLYGGCYGGYNSLIWFIYLYLSSGYVKLHGVPSWLANNSGKIFWSLAFAFWIATASFSLMQYFRSGISFHLMSSAYDGPMFFLSICAVVYFLKINISNKILIGISKLAPYTFGVYLIHENAFLKGCGLWSKVIPDNLDMPMPLHCVLISVAIFLSCCCIDWMRSKLFKVINVDRFAQKITAKLPKTL